MNKRHCIGTLHLLKGRLYESTGQLVGNRNLAYSGVALQMRGKSQIAIGEAQRIIKSCVKRSQVPL